MDIHEELTNAQITKDMKENAFIFRELNTICNEQIDMDLYEFLEFYASVITLAKVRGITPIVDLNIRK